MNSEMELNALDYLCYFNFRSINLHHLYYYYGRRRQANMSDQRLLNSYNTQISIRN